ncbi:transposase [bacterium]|nr:transposase [FCB group bacterium]MBL7190246.1 transposase [bacterium]
MGRRLRTLITGPTLFFVTLSTIGRKDVFTDTKKLDLAESSLFEVVQNKNCHLMAYVIMPNHIHLLMGVKNGGKELSRFIFSLKGLIRKRLSGNKDFWNERFDDLVIRSEEQFLIKLNYIHNNPVKRGLSASPEDWRYSSFKFWNNEINHPILKKDLSFYS